MRPADSGGSRSQVFAIDIRRILTVQAEDAAIIKRLGVKIKKLEAAAWHEIEVAEPIDAAFCESVIIWDTLVVMRQKVETQTPHIELKRYYRKRTIERLDPNSRDVTADRRHG